MLSHLYRQHSETVRRCEHTMKDMEYYRGQHHAAMTQLEAAAQETSTLRAKYGDLASDKQRLEREVAEMRSHQVSLCVYLYERSTLVLNPEC